MTVTSGLRPGLVNHTKTASGGLGADATGAEKLMTHRFQKLKSTSAPVDGRTAGFERSCTTAQKSAPVDCPPRSMGNGRFCERLCTRVAAKPKSVTPTDRESCRLATCDREKLLMATCDREKLPMATCRTAKSY